MPSQSSIYPDGRGERSLRYNAVIPPNILGSLSSFCFLTELV